MTIVETIQDKGVFLSQCADDGWIFIYYCSRSCEALTVPPSYLKIESWPVYADPTLRQQPIGIVSFDSGEHDRSVIVADLLHASDSQHFELVALVRGSIRQEWENVILLLPIDDEKEDVTSESKS